MHLNKNISQFLFLLAFVCTQGNLLYAQDGEIPIEQRKMPVSFRFDGGLGNIVSPKAMKNSFYSVGDLSGGFFFGLGRNWRAGISMRYTGFQIRQGAANVNDTVIDGLIYQVRTVYNMYTPSLSIGYDTWVGKYSFFNFNLQVGQGLVRWGKIRNSFKGDPAVHNYNTMVIEPAVNFMYFFEDHIAMTLKLSYTQTNGWFRPETVGLDGGVISYTSPELKGNIRLISFGLGFVYSFKRID